MKTKSPFLLIAFIFLSNTFGFSQNAVINGAWQTKDGSKESVILFQDGYFTETEYSANEFLKTIGGPYTQENNKINVLVEFNSADSTTVGQPIEFDASIKNQQLNITWPQKALNYARIDDGNSPLAGVWKINGREQDGKLVTIHQTGARKTLKILTGKRFQWFAINPELKQFSGTGGGTYTFTDGKYTENIQFFSRDNSRVGAQLTFDGKIEDGQWHHSGLSSKGDKIYEVWGKINADK